MRLLARIGLLLLAAVCIAIFVFGAFRFVRELGISPIRYVLQDILVALAGALGFVACLMKSRKLAKQQQAQLDAMQFTGNRFEANASKAPAILLAVLLVGVVLLAAFSLFRRPVDPGPVLAAALFALLLLGLLAMALAQFRSGKPSLVMDGFCLDHVLYGPIRWDQIQGIFLREFQMRGRKIYSLHLLVLKPGRFLMQGPWWRRMLLSAKRRDAAIGELALPLGNLDQPATMVQKAALALRARVNPALVADWAPGMSEQAIKLQQETTTSLERLDSIAKAMERGAVSPDQANSDMQSVLAEIDAQNALRLPLLRESAAKAKRALWFNAALTVGLVLYVMLRIFYRRH